MTTRLLADTVQDIFGGPIDPQGPAGLTGGTVQEGVSSIVTFGINTIFTVATITVLIMAMWGAYSWITAGGQADKIEEARNRIAQAFIGLLILVSVLGIWRYVGCYVINVLECSNGGFQFTLPQFIDGSGGSSGGGGGGGTNPGTGNPGGGSNPGPGGGSNPGDPRIPGPNDPPIAR